MHFFTLKLENRPPDTKIVEQPRDGPGITSNTSGGTNLENKPPEAKFGQQLQDGPGNTSNTSGGTNPWDGPGNTSNTSGGTNVSCGNLQNNHGTPSLKTKSKNATEGQKHAIATGRPGEHLKHLGRDQCKLWKLTELTFGGQNRATATRRPGEHLKHLGRDQCELWKLTELTFGGQNRATATGCPGNTSNTSEGTNIRDLIWTCLVIWRADGDVFGNPHTFFVDIRRHIFY
ncbi:hypothetical protein CsSME_00037084 [Camellia sinensis var. sinensis]